MGVAWWRQSAGRIAQAVRDGEVTATEVTENFEARFEETYAWTRAYSRRLPDILQQATRVDAEVAAGRAGPLAGVPVAIKDNLVTEGGETTCGSRVLQGWVPPYDATAVARLRAAGAIILGKTGMDEFGMGSSGENTPFPTVRNPWSTTHVPGGSSGGSAAAVAEGSCVGALGSDTGGSVRQPAAYCGVVGLKPTWGRVSRRGLVAFASSLDVVGPMGRTTCDVARMLDVIAGPDPLDATSVGGPRPTDYLAACDRGLQGIRIGVARGALDSAEVDDEVRALFEISLQRFSEAGAVLVEVELPHFDLGIAAYYVVCMAEASSNLARFDGLRYGSAKRFASLEETYEATRSQFGAEVKRRILLGTFALRAESYEDYYGRAMRVRALIARDHDRAFARCDLLASPTTAGSAFRVGAHHDDPVRMYRSDVLTVGASLAGLPAISVPNGFVGRDQCRLPVGIQLTGRAYEEGCLLAAAHAHEQRVEERPWPCMTNEAPA